MHPTTAAAQPLRGNVHSLDACGLALPPMTCSLAVRAGSCEVEAWVVIVQSVHDCSSRGEEGGPRLHHLQTVRPAGPMSRGSSVGRVTKPEPAKMETHAGQVHLSSDNDLSSK